MIPIGLLPIGYTWMVAGGWAVCPALASDMDVFVLIDPEQAEDVRALILAGLKNYGFDFEPEGGVVEDIHRLQYGSRVLRVAKVTSRWATIHILLGLGPKPEDVLDTFDLSICQVGIMQDGTLVKGSEYTNPLQPIKVVRDTPTTEARLAKYQARFHNFMEIELGENL